MGLCTFFHGEIRNVGMKEFTECLSALTGHYYFLQDEEGTLFDPQNVRFEEKEKMEYFPYKDKDNHYHIPYGKYNLVCVANCISYRVEIEEDISEDPNYAAGLKIKLFDFVDKPYEEGDFSVVSGLCEHLGFSNYEIRGDYNQEPILKSFDKMSTDYIRNIRNSKTDLIVRIVDGIIANHYYKDKPKEKPDIDGIFQLIIEKRNEEKAELLKMYPWEEPENETTYLFNKAVVSGFYECNLSLEEYKEEIKKVYDKTIEGRILKAVDIERRIDNIFREFEEARSEFESNSLEPQEL